MFFLCAKKKVSAIGSVVELSDIGPIDAVDEEKLARTSLGDVRELLPLARSFRLQENKKERRESGQQLS